MGLFDTLESEALGALGGNAARSLVGPLLQTLGGGGLHNVVGQLAAGGLAREVESWVSTGANLPVTANQIQQALAPTVAQDLAAKAGLPVGDVHGVLAQLLPRVVDHLTPNGQLPSPSAALPEVAAVWSALVK